MRSDNVYGYDEAFVSRVLLEAYYHLAYSLHMKGFP
jgi:hypothetical protein